MSALLSDEAIQHLIDFVDRLRPASQSRLDEAAGNMARQLDRLQKQPEEAARLGETLAALLGMPQQGAFYAETGVRSALGFWLEVRQRLGHRLLPLLPDNSQLRDVFRRVFPHAWDPLWVDAVAPEAWQTLLDCIGLPEKLDGTKAMANLMGALRLLSFRLAGAALDRELLRADPDLERHESPFLAQNELLMPLLQRVEQGGQGLNEAEVAELRVLLEQCQRVLERVRRRAGEFGISVRLTYLLARLQQLLERLDLLLAFCLATDRRKFSLGLLVVLVAGEQSRHRLWDFVGENISLLARNVTENASRHGEHYIAENRRDWLAMARSAAGGGVVIAGMAAIKVELAKLHLPPLTEGLAFGLNYGLGFALIHLLGFTVATKQPAMTAAAIAATLEGAREREMERLADLAQNVVRTQFVAVLGNVALAFPVACLIAMVWPRLFGGPLASEAKVMHMLAEVHPFLSASLFFAAVAGVGLFLSGLVSGYLDNQARYHQLALRLPYAPGVAWLGEDRARRFGLYLDAHYGAILGNLFFGMYLGLMGALGSLTGLPVDIRHVAFSSANLGTAVMALESAYLYQHLGWAAVGVACIGLVNLVVSFALALYVAMKSRRQGAAQIVRLAGLLAKRFVRQPLSFIVPPRS